MFTIGKLAKAAGVGVETVRFYERKGLIEQPRKPEGGFRTYPEQTLKQIQFIKRAQTLGFTLKEITHLMTIRDAPCSEVYQLSMGRLSEIEEKISDLVKLKSALRKLSDSCEENSDQSHCPIVESLMKK